MNIKNVGIGKKIFLGIGITLVLAMIFMAGIMNMRFNDLREDTVERVRSFLLEQEENRIIDVTETTAHVFSELYAENEGQLSEGELQALLDEYNQDIDFGETGYFFIYSYEGETISLPPTPDLVGDNRWDIQDTNGTYILRELSETAADEGGFVEYYYANPDTGEDELKTSYAAPIPGTDYFMGAGIYDSFIVSSTEKIRSEMGDLIGNIFTVLLIFLIGTIVVVGVVILLISRYISGNINDVLTGMNKVADGDLNHEIDNDSEDELGQLSTAYNKTVASLREMIGKIQTEMEELNQQGEELAASGQEVERTAEQVGRAIENVASGAEEQSAQMDESKTLIDDLIKQIESTRSKSAEMDQSSQEVIGSIQKGTNSMDKSIEQVNQVRTYSNEIADKINNLGGLSQKIGEIVELINGISQQTNLLALNAAIEAARAGEAGRGFSVVADEIRELAEESSRATENISGLIKEIQTGVNESVAKMDETEAAVDGSVEVIEDTGAVFTSIEEAVKNLNNMIEEISGQTEEMDRLSDGVHNTINDVAAVSEEAAGNAEEVAASSEEQIASTEEIVASSHRLAEMSDELSALIDRFEIEDK